ASARGAAFGDAGGLDRHREPAKRGVSLRDTRRLERGGPHAARDLRRGARESQSFRRGRPGALRGDRSRAVFENGKQPGNESEGETLSLLVQRPGLLTTVQDRGRHGHHNLGLVPGGAMDWPAVALANALV